MERQRLSRNVISFRNGKPVPSNNQPVRAALIPRAPTPGVGPRAGGQGFGGPNSGGFIPGHATGPSTGAGFGRGAGIGPIAAGMGGGNAGGIGGMTGWSSVPGVGPSGGQNFGFIPGHATEPGAGMGGGGAGMGPISGGVGRMIGWSSSPGQGQPRAGLLGSGLHPQDAALKRELNNQIRLKSLGMGAYR